MRKPIAKTILLSLFLTSIIYYSIKSVQVSTSWEVGGSSITLPESDTAFGGLFYMPAISDSLPYFVYKKIQDSIQNIKDGLLIEHNIASGSSFSVNNFGLGKLKFLNHAYSLEKYVESLDSLQRLKLAQKDSTMIKKIDLKIDSLSKGFTQKEKTETSDLNYHIILENYEIEEHSKFYIQNNNYYLAFVVWDSLKPSDDKIKHGHYQKKEVNILYSEKQKKLYLPISKRAYSILSPILNTLFFLFLLLSILIIFILPVAILISISQGFVFTSRNILGLRIISYSFIILSILKIAGPFIFHFIFKSRIPEELQPMTWKEIVSESYLYIIVSVVLLAILKAFERGYKIQQEQDLTV